MFFSSKRLKQVPVGVKRKSGPANHNAGFKRGLADSFLDTKVSNYRFSFSCFVFLSKQKQNTHWWGIFDICSSSQEIGWPCFFWPIFQKGPICRPLKDERPQMQHLVIFPMTGSYLNCSLWTFTLIGENLVFFGSVGTPRPAEKSSPRSCTISPSTRSISSN